MFAMLPAQPRVASLSLPSPKLLARCSAWVSSQWALGGNNIHIHIDINIWVCLFCRVVASNSSNKLVNFSIFYPMGSGSYPCYCLSIAYRLPLMPICSAIMDMGPGPGPRAQIWFSGRGFLGRGFFISQLLHFCGGAKAQRQLQKHFEMCGGWRCT